MNTTTLGLKPHSKHRLKPWRVSLLIASVFLMACGGSGGAEAKPSEDKGKPTTPGKPNKPTQPETPDTDTGNGSEGGDEPVAPENPYEPEVPVEAGQISVDGTLYNDIAAAQSAIQPGSLVVLGSGVYSQGLYIGHDDVTVQGSEGTHFKGAAIQGKGTFVVDGNNVVIEGIECSGVSVPDQNGACVRQQGQDLMLSNVYFHDSEQGVLSAQGSGKLTIEYSRFEQLGKAGRAHAVYSNNDSLEIRYSRFYSSKDQGHEIKSRAPRTLIEYSEIASLSGVDSRLVDVSNGGALTIRNSVLEQGPNTSNYQLIGFGLEGMTNSVAPSVVLENNIVLLERANGNVFLGLPSDSSGISISITGNDFIGEAKFNDKAQHNIPANNRLFTDRTSYGLGAFPELPDIGVQTP